MCNTPKAPGVNAGGIKQARYEIEKRTRTSKSWFERASVDLDYKVLPVVMRHCAWQITHRHVRTDTKKQIERPLGRPHSGQVSDFAEVNHFRDPQKAADMSKLNDRWRQRLWMRTTLVSGGQYMGTPAGVRRCRSICRRPGGLRVGHESVERNDWRSMEQTIASGRDATDAMRSVHHSEATDQEWWPERLHGVLQTCRSVFSGVTNTVTGHRGQ